MAARGANEKKEVMDKILEVFEGSFVYNGGKEVRIPVGEVQIKVSLTCAKDNVEPGGDSALPGATKEKVEEIKQGDFSFAEDEERLVEPSQEEKDALTDFMSALDL